MTSTTIWIILAFLMLASWLALRARQARGERAPYESARARIEGGGVKRGLTPPEGAILLGRPLNVSLTLVVFEMLRKGFLRQLGEWPLRVEVAEAFRTRGSGLSMEARGQLRRHAAQALSKPMHIYEEAFLEILEQHPGTPAAEIDYSIAIQPLVRYVASRVDGYDLEDTREYYRLIIARAPREARSDGVLTIERQKVFDRNFGWLLLNDDFKSLLDAEDYSYLPVWMRESNPLAGRSFADWAADVMADMQRAVPAEEADLGLERELDQTTATLMNEIARATYRG